MPSLETGSRRYTLSRYPPKLMAFSGHGELHRTVHEIVVRRVGSADAARMRALRLEMLADSPTAFLETIDQAAARPHAEFLERIVTCATGPDRAQFIAEANGAFIGNAGGKAERGHPRTVLFAVYITPAYRGSGALEKLIAAAADWSRSAGRPELVAEVVESNQRALRAYLRLGFTDTGVRNPHPRYPDLYERVLSRRA